MLKWALFYGWWELIAEIKNSVVLLRLLEKLQLAKAGRNF